MISNDLSRALGAAFVVASALGCSSQAGPGPSPVTTETTTVTAVATGSVGVATAPPANAQPSSTGAVVAPSASSGGAGSGQTSSPGSVSPGLVGPGVAGKCARDGDCARGTHCGLGLPLNGTCWPDGKPEPRCLSGDTRIATPKGEIAVRDLRPGTVVWTVDARGQRVQAPLTAVTHRPVSPGHVMRHVVFDDGRSLLVSPDHPTCASAETTQGATRSPATLFDLDVGLRYDRGVVKRAERASYDESETFDVLPSGDTGCYWANGVLLGSTLR